MIKTQNLNKNQTKHNYKKILKRSIISIACIIVLGISFFFGIQIYMIQSTKKYIINDVSEAPVSDAVMVLGALVYGSGRPSPTLRDRLDYGYELYIQGKAKKILVSGDNGQIEYDEVNNVKTPRLKQAQKKSRVPPW